MIPVDIAPSTLSPTTDHAAAYAALVNDAVDARQAIDTGRWLLGEYTRMLMDTALYGAHTIDEFADDIGIEPSRLYEYGAMATYYTAETRALISHLNLTYSHMREARRLKDIEKSVRFLHLIFANLWTIQQTRDALKTMRENDGVYVSPTFDKTPITDMNGNRIDQRPVYQWRGPATVSIDDKGIRRLVCEGLTEYEQGTRLMVSVEEY